MLRLLDLAEERGSLDSLLEKVEIARKKVPGWKAADAMQVLVLCSRRPVRPARVDLSRGRSTRCRRTRREIPESYRVLILLDVSALELARYPATARPRLHRVRGDAWPTRIPLLQFRLLRATEPLPARRAGAACARRPAVATKLAAPCSTWHTPNGPCRVYPDETASGIRMVGLDAIGTSLVELGFAADAVPLFREAQALSERVDPSVLPSALSTIARVPRQIEEHLNAAIDG